MVTHKDLEQWITEALTNLGGRQKVPKVAQYIWENYEKDLRKSGDLFYTWQYAMRWAGQRLQKAGKLKKYRDGWELV